MHAARWTWVLIGIAGLAAPTAFAPTSVCFSDVHATLDGDRLTVTWRTHGTFDAIHVQRHFEATGWRTIATVGGSDTTYATDVEPTVQHDIRLVGVAGGTTCASEGVTAVGVPELPGGVAVALAAVGGVAGYAFLRRR